MLPAWLLEADRPVPRTRAFEMQAISSRIHAFLLALINGERSMRDMARMLVEQRLMSAEEAEAQVRIFLTRLHEDSERINGAKWGHSYFCNNRGRSRYGQSVIDCYGK